MNKFEDFNIKSSSGAFEGKKINFSEVFNVPIIVKDFKIEESKFTGKNKSNNRLQLSFIMDGEDFITFSGSDNLMDMINKVPKDCFPFETTIKKKEKRFEFT
ncbi:MAG: hypothetical protein PHI59_09050 [Candidatus Omnitrophica bacterium]|nr:hypothetical protein [Candidatus Omnitrophota bacterium]